MSRLFSEILLDFLISKIGDLSGPKSDVLLQLFKLVFQSVVSYPENESILLPHLAPIITDSMRWAGLVKDPTNYFYFLRSLFQSIANSVYYSFLIST